MSPVKSTTTALLDFLSILKMSLLYSPVWRQRFKQPKTCVKLVYTLPDKQDQTTAVSEAFHDITAIPQYKVQCKYMYEKAKYKLLKINLPPINVSHSFPNTSPLNLSLLIFKCRLKRKIYCFCMYVIVRLACREQLVLHYTTARFESIFFWHQKSLLCVALYSVLVSESHHRTSL